MSLSFSQNSRHTVLCVALLVAAPAAARTDEARLARMPGFFSSAQLVAGLDLVECALSGGTRTTCFSVTVRQTPQTQTPGPWCPTHISDRPEAGGIWFLDGQTVDVGRRLHSPNSPRSTATPTGSFTTPDTGAVRVSGTLETCEAAARPDVDPAYQNHCVLGCPNTCPRTQR